MYIIIHKQKEYILYAHAVRWFTFKYQLRLSSQVFIFLILWSLNHWLIPVYIHAFINVFIQLIGCVSLRSIIVSNVRSFQRPIVRFLPDHSFDNIIHSFDVSFFFIYRSFVRSFVCSRIPVYVLLICLFMCSHFLVISILLLTLSVTCSVLQVAEWCCRTPPSVRRWTGRVLCRPTVTSPPTSSEAAATTPVSAAASPKTRCVRRWKASVCRRTNAAPSPTASPPL